MTTILNMLLPLYSSTVIVPEALRRVESEGLEKVVVPLAGRLTNRVSLSSSTSSCIMEDASMFSRMSFTRLNPAWSEEKIAMAHIPKMRMAVIASVIVKALLVLMGNIILKIDRMRNKNVL